ncbi:MAG: hypothetical protein ACPGEF_03780 [Endozoicomonas sp.]
MKNDGEYSVIEPCIVGDWCDDGFVYSPHTSAYCHYHGSTFWGLHSGMSLTETINTMNDHLQPGAEVGISYIMVGTYAMAICGTGLVENFSGWFERCISNGSVNKARIKIILIFGFIAILSQTFIPIHIAFIPILLPPLIGNL